jgi:RNA polymerase sigma factor (sigma-70 family)
MAAGQLRGVVRKLRTLSLSASTPGPKDGQLLELFISRRDEAAFAALLRRHGPMVLGTCRRIVGNIHDAEDAFQATFLILVRKARSIVPRDMVGNWLYGVACRTALKVKTARARRRVKEGSMAMPEAAAQSDWNELLPILDIELKRLPDKYRAAIVLCDLEGKSRSEAARQLSLPVGTVATRVTRGRALLARKLARHGSIFSGPALAMLFSANPSCAGVPGYLQLRTVQAAVLDAAQALATGVVSTKVVVLTEGVLKAMLLGKLKIAMVLLLAATMLGSVTSIVPAPTTVADERKPAQPGVPSPAQGAVSSERAFWRTENFLVDAPTIEIARQVGAAAERRRKDIAVAWLGKELPPWPTRCPIHVKITAGRGQSSTSFCFADGKVLSQHVDLEGSLGGILRADLPREMAHVVLAAFFKQPVPRWADEGVAMCIDEVDYGGEWTRRLKLLPDILNDRQRFLPLQRLLAQSDYPADLHAFLAESFSVVRFLASARDLETLPRRRRTFIWFISQALRDGWDEAVRTHYGYAGVKELERAWLRNIALKTSTSRQAAEQPRVKGGQKDDVAWQVLGLRLEPTDAAEVSKVNPQLHGGLKITAVRPHSPAAEQKVRPGDILVGLHQWETLYLDNVPDSLAYCQRDGIDTITFYIVRDGGVRRGFFALNGNQLTTDEGRERIPRHQLRSVSRQIEDGERERIMAILAEIEGVIREIKAKIAEK